MSTVSRNALCPCGSGKKYKRCCLDKKRMSSSSHVAIPEKNCLLQTLTQEWVQPMRLYYSVHKNNRLLSELSRLRCLDAVDYSRFTWKMRYADEAAHMALQVPVKNLSDQSTLVIATLTVKDPHTLLIDVRSIERATQLIEFIDAHISRNIIQITHAAIYNKIMKAKPSELEQVQKVDFDKLFDEKYLVLIDHEKTKAEFESLATRYKDKTERLAALFQKLDEDAKAPLPELEKMPVHYYEDGIDSFNLTCRIRQMIALEHAGGNHSFSLYDATQRLFYSDDS